MPSRSFLILSAAVLVVFTILTRQRNEVWRDPIRLWSNAAEQAPYKPRPWLNLAKAERDSGNEPMALSVYGQIIRSFPDNAQVVTLAQVYTAGIRMHRGELRVAQGILERILVEQGQYPTQETLPAYNHLAFVYAVTGRGEDALKLLDTLIALDGDWRMNASANFNRGLAFQSLGNCKEAVSAFRTAHWIDAAVEVPVCP